MIRGVRTFGIFAAELAVVATLSLSSVAVAGEDAKHGKEAAEEELSLPPQAQPELTPAEQYCSNIIDAASAAQIAQQKNNLEKAQKELDRRVELVAAKTEELKSWIKRREDFTAQATESLTQIYGKMKPDAAAAQLVSMNELVAAAILAKLSPKSSSAILSEMQAPRAARLSAVIASAGNVIAKTEQAADAK